MIAFKNISIITLCIFAVLVISGRCGPAFADTGDVGVYIDGTAVAFPDVKPYISDDRTLVPARFISEQLGASVSWDNDTGTVTIISGNDRIELVIGSTKVVKNGVSSSMDVAPVITDGRTMVPLRFVSEQLGAAVEWNGANNSVLITTPKTSASSPTLTTYTVKAGDTLWRIASSHGVKVEALLNVNPGLDPDKLQIGQQLNLPSGSAADQPDTSLAADQQSTSSAAGISENGTDPVDSQVPVISRGGGRTISLNCTADELIEYAEGLLGAPYSYGGTTPGGFDCSGFTQYVAAHFGGYLPHSSIEQYHYGINVEKDDLQPGDLVFFEASDEVKTIGHVGIYVGDGKFIHAPQAGGAVEISNLSNVYFDQHYYGAVRMNLSDEEQAR